MRKYHEYKQTEIQWLEQIPKNWYLEKLKYKATIQFSNVDKLSDETETSVLLCNYVDVYRNEKIHCGIDFMQATANAKEIEKFIIKKGDVIITKDSESVDDIAVPALVVEDFENVLCGYHLAQIKTQKDLTSEYLFRLFQSKDFNQNFESSASGMTRYGLSVYSIKNVVIPIPPLPEQQCIVHFLDYKTGQIDSFITNRQKQIELLKEQKTSMINYAITRGINKNTKFKKSETLTLDYYPEHWKLTKVKYLLKKKRAAIRTGPFGTQLKKSDLKEDGEIKIYNQRSVIDKNFIGGDEYISLEKYENLKEFVVNPNDFLITTRGTIGKCAVFPNNMQIGVLHPCLIRMQLDERIISNEYAMACLENALYFQEEIKLLSNSTVIEVIYSYNLKEVVLPIPPIEEQNCIIRYIKEETSTIDTLITKYQKQIDLIQEYRTSLISQAVTGKIDVREWQPKK